MKIVVLGAGLVGAPMAKDLAKDTDIQVTVADINDAALAKLSSQDHIKAVKADLSDTDKLKNVVAPSDIVINAVPGFMGYATLHTIIGEGKNVVDIAFFPENPDALHLAAKEKGVTAVVDCGVAPGMSNMLVGHCYGKLDKTESAIIYVGGLPEVRQWPYEYKAVFSPIDVIEEYTRPAFFKENGMLIEKPALSDMERIDLPEMGTLEAFNTDGLRSLIKTLDIPTMREKTLRYTGHIEKMAMLRESGFFSSTPIQINGISIRPIDMTAKLLFPMWQLKEGEADITVMKVVVEGEKDGELLRYTWEMVDRYDESTGVHSMGRTTGYTATMVARLIKEKRLSRKGVLFPEQIAADPDCMDFILKGLADRGVVYKETVTKR
jgi:saccharopine dehydrogenase-like NADP-dependent oxidoreductase